MKDPNSHPKRKFTEPTTAQLDALLARKLHVTLRERLVCSLCEQVPKEIQSLAEKKKGSLADMYEVFVDHVANHMQSLSLISLPCFNNVAVALATDEESVPTN